MWNLPLPDSETKNWYINKLANKVKNKIGNLTTTKAVYKRVLLPKGKLDVIESLLTLEPVDSVSLCDFKMNELLTALHKGTYNVSELSLYRKAKNKKAKNRDANEKTLINKYDKILTTLGNIFDYQDFITKDADFSYMLSKKKQARTCTYCGREYIYTVEDLSDDDKVKQVARPDFDHWMSHELFPMLALNYCNLIPCCQICNRSVKGTQLMKIGEHVHPYINKKEPGFRFSYKILDIDKPQGEVIIVNDNNPLEKATIEMFQLRALYRYHSETELDDMLRIGLKNGKQYVEEYLVNIMGGLNISVGNAYRSIFGGELYDNVNDERPLSKFKRDILSELGILDLFETAF